MRENLSTSSVPERNDVTTQERPADAGARRSEEVKVHAEPMTRRRLLQVFSLAAAAGAGITSCSPKPNQLRRQNAEAEELASHGQKGVGLGVGKSHTVDQLDALHLDWFYTWGSAFPNIEPRDNFVPMIWGEGAVRRNAPNNVQAELPITRATELLGFNEPDNPDQADMSPGSAVRLWPKLEATGLRLGSPGPVHINGDWFKEFMDRAAAADLRVDFIAVHSYASPKSENFLNKLQEVHDRYSKPIWVTEYAVADWEATKSAPSRHSEKEIMAFMGETVAGMRAMPFVERFAWKTRANDDPVMGASALFRGNRSLTPTGELYQSL